MLQCPVCRQSKSTCLVSGWAGLIYCILSLERFLGWVRVLGDDGLWIRGLTPISLNPKAWSLTPKPWLSFEFSKNARKLLRSEVKSVQRYWSRPSHHPSFRPSLLVSLFLLIFFFFFRWFRYLILSLKMNQWEDFYLVSIRYQPLPGESWKCGFHMQQEEAGVQATLFVSGIQFGLWSLFRFEFGCFFSFYRLYAFFFLCWSLYFSWNLYFFFSRTVSHLLMCLKE